MALPLIPDPPPQGHARGQVVSRGCRFPSFQDSYERVVRVYLNPFQAISRKTNDSLLKALVTAILPSPKVSPRGSFFIR
jgi:hypothetical protein